MDSLHEQSGADKVFAVLPNNTYAEIVASNLGAAQIAVATNVQALIFWDHLGNMCKTLQDASGASTIPEDSIIHADSTGKATSDTMFKFDATNARLQLPAVPFTIAFGDQDADGSLRIRATADGFYFGKRVSGAWDESEILII